MDKGYTEELIEHYDIINNILRKNNAGSISVENRVLRIDFAERVIAKEFVGYFGNIQRLILDKSMVAVELDFRNVQYINMLCISKIILTIFETKDNIDYTIYWPSAIEHKSNKMLRFLYNKGILDLLFSLTDVGNIIEGDYISDYRTVYDFSDCIDVAIFPYKVFKVEKRSAKRYSKEQVTNVVNDIMQGIQTYFTSKKMNGFEHVKNRVYLYLYEIVENVFAHAYINAGFFGIMVTYDYLPRYLWNKDKESKQKYQNRGRRLQKENPLSLFGDIEDRYAGGISVWVDDIGKGIAKTVRGGFYQQMYRDTFLSGLDEQLRGRGKTRLNGLKLVGDEIANNGDYLWLHDCWHWVGSHCNELKSTIALPDSSRREGKDGYEYAYIAGCCYEIKVNLSRNSREKNNSYNSFGSPLHVQFEELREICKDAIEHQNENSEIVIVDLVNSDNHSRRTEDFFAKPCKYFLYRSRAIRKEQFKSELFERIFLKMEPEYSFEELIVFDLSQTALFQIRALIETKQYSEVLISHGVECVVLLSTEFFVFAMEVVDGIFRLKRQFSLNYLERNRKKLLVYLEAFQRNDNNMVNSIVVKNKKNMLICADIQWGSMSISKYIDIENMLRDRQVFTVLQKMLIRISGVLAQDLKLCFIEDFFENAFLEYVNEFSNARAPKAFVGSLLLTKQTERKRAMEEDKKIYLFFHEESEIKCDNTYVFLFSFPQVRMRKQKLKYRRIQATHRIERYMEESDEFKFYQSKKYENLINRIQFHIGLYSTGLFSIVKNEELMEAYKEFIYEQVNIIVKKYETVELKGDESLLCFVEDVHAFLGDIQKKVINNGNSRLLVKKFIESGEPVEAKTVIYITQKVDIMKMLELKSSNQSYIIISLFNEIKVEEGLDRLISNGYIPFIPLYYKDVPIIRDDELKVFKAFSMSLVPTLRKEIDSLFEKTQGSFNFDFLSEFQRNFTIKGSFSILYDAIIDAINYSTNTVPKNVVQGCEYSLLRSVILWQSQKVDKAFSYNERLLENVLRELECQMDKSASLLVYYIMVVLYIFRASLSIKTIEAQRDRIKSILRNAKNPLIRVVFANILEQWNNVEFRIELNEIFVGNDISLYYQMLYQNLFNNFGEDHDSVISKYCKNKELSADEINRLLPLVNECVSLLKLTRPYQEEKGLAELEMEIKKHHEERVFDFEFRQKCEMLKEFVKKRFVIFDTTTLKNDLENFVLERLWNGAIQKDKDISVSGNLEEYVICSDKKPEQKSKIIFPNDDYVIDEIIYLLLDAIKYSEGIKITTISNEEKSAIVWTICGVEDGQIVIKFFNHITENFEEIMHKIRSKKRVGKTHLEKFNVDVSYEEDPAEVKKKCEGEHTIMTRIAIPYFS